MSEEEPEEYNELYYYDIGERVFVDYSKNPDGSTNPSGFNPDGTPAILYYTCIRYHNPNVDGESYPPIRPEMFPDEQRYLRDWESKMWWELEWPVWDAVDQKWGQDGLCTYDGRYFELTWRATKRWDKVAKVYTERQLIDGYPNELEDEDGIRVWQTTAHATIGHTRVCSFDLAPFNLERYYDNPDAREVELNPYGDPQYPFAGSIWYHGVGASIGRFSGASLMVYQDYPPDIRTVQIPVYNDRTGGIEAYETSEETVVPGGTTSAGLCGCAFQRYQEGIFWLGTISALDPVADDDPYYGDPIWEGVEFTPPEGWKDPLPGWDGGYPESPPFWNPAKFGLNFFDPSVPETITIPAQDPTPEWHRFYYVFWSHNHPLFFRRTVKVQATITVRMGFWKKVIGMRPDLTPPHNPVEDIVGYTAPMITSTFTKRGSLKPRDDCFASQVPSDQQPYNGNAIGKLTTQGGSFVVSYPGAPGSRPDLTPGNIIFGQGEGLLFVVEGGND